MSEDVVSKLRLAADPDGNVRDLDDLMILAADEIERLRGILDCVHPSDRREAEGHYEHPPEVSGE